jgi:hypothetical protein
METPAERSDPQAPHAAGGAGACRFPRLGSPPRTPFPRRPLSKRKSTRGETHPRGHSTALVCPTVSPPFGWPAPRRRSTNPPNPPGLQPCNRLRRLSLSLPGRILLRGARQFLQPARCTAHDFQICTENRHSECLLASPRGRASAIRHTEPAAVTERGAPCSPLPELAPPEKSVPVPSITPHPSRSCLMLGISHAYPQNAALERDDEKYLAMIAQPDVTHSAGGVRGRPPRSDRATPTG